MGDNREPQTLPAVLKPTEPNLNQTHKVYKLTPQRKRFALRYAKTGNKIEAARYAGYSERTAASHANKLLTMRVIIDIIDRETARLRKKADITYVEIVQNIRSDRRFARRLKDKDGRPNPQLSVAMSGNKLMAEMGGFLKDADDNRPEIHINIDEVKVSPGAGRGEKDD